MAALNNLQSRGGNMGPGPNPGIVNNTITYQMANSQIQGALRSNQFPIDAMCSWIEIFFNNEYETSTFNANTFKSFMYRMALEDLVTNQFGGNFNAVQPDPTVPIYQPKFLIKETQVIKTKNPVFEAAEAAQKGDEGLRADMQQMQHQMQQLMQIMAGKAKTSSVVSTEDE